MEDALCVVLQGFFASFHCLVVGCGGVFGLSYLNYCATAVPSIGWIVGLPEGVGRRERHAVERSVFGTHLAVAGRAVLEVVAVAVFGELLPLGCHLGRGLYEIVLGTEVVRVVGVVDSLNVVQKAFNEGNASLSSWKVLMPEKM